MGSDFAKKTHIGGRLAGFIRTTLVGGLLVLVPVAACIYVLIEAVDAVLQAVTPFARLFPVQELGGIEAATILAVLIVLAVSFLLGLLVRTTVGSALGRWFDKKLGGLLPGYNLIKKLSHQVAGKGDEKLGAPVLVRNGPHRQFGFMVEEHASGEVTVFVPSVPALSVGSLYVVDRGAVSKLNVSVTKVVNCITRYGIGSAELLVKK